MSISRQQTAVTHQSTPINQQQTDFFIDYRIRFRLIQIIENVVLRISKRTQHVEWF
ncbi:MAG: hypothetical protein M5E90_03460 [Asgard group archaeon]|nr:hypothetical protein [Asgard group archaeon]